MVRDKRGFNKLPGKHVGDRVYIHRTSIAMLPEELHDRLQELDELFFKNKWGKGYNIIKLDILSDDVSFILSDEFDVVDEPRIDFAYVIRDKKLFRVIDYSKYKKESISIYHHKWSFVSPHYKGFDIEKSKRRSEWWENHPVVLKRKKEDKYFKSKIGSTGYWNKLLEEIGDYDIRE